MTFIFKDREYTLHFHARRTWNDFHVVKPYQAGLRGSDLRGVVWGRISFLSCPLCSACLNDGTLPNGDGCPTCCEHDFDPSEGYTCLNCGAEGDMGALIDHAEILYGGDR